MIYAPVIIPTLNRYEHFKRCVESLAANSWAKYTELYVGVDYPSAEKYVEGYKRIKEYLEHGIDGFDKVNIYYHESNLGSSENVYFLQNEAAKKYDRFICSEDDNEFAENFIEYVDCCLEKYADDESVIAVSGYNYPMNITGNGGDIYFSDCYFAAYGYGTWFKKYRSMLNYLTTEWVVALYKNSSYMKKLYNKSTNQYCNFVKAMLNYAIPIINSNGIRKIDLTYGLYMLDNSKKMIFPVSSKSRNWGFDGTGENCTELEFNEKKTITHRNNNYSSQRLDSGDNVEICEVDEIKRTVIDKAVNDYFDIPFKELLLTIVSYCVSRIIGIDRMSSIIKSKR